MQPNEIDPGEALDDAEGGEGLSKFWLAVLLFSFFALVGLTTIGAMVRVTSLESEVETRAMIQDAEPLCAAIDAFTKQHGRAPETLGVLVPEFIAELPPLHADADPGFKYRGSETEEWTLSIWGGGFEYTRISIDEPWFITGDTDQTYARDSWVPLQ